MNKLKVNQLTFGAAISYFSMAFNIIAGLLYTPWMVGKIGQSNYGLFTLANSIVTMLMLDFGLGSAVSRYVAKYRAEGRTDAINNILGVIYKLYIAIDAIILVILSIVYFFLGAIYKELTPTELDQFKTLYIIVSAYHIIAFPFTPLNGVLNAHEKFIQLKICDLFSKVLSIAAVVSVLFFTNDVRIVIFANVFSHFLIVVAKLVFAKIYVPAKVNIKASGKGLYKDLFSFTAWTTVISLAQRFTHSLAPSVLAMTSGAIEIALYAPAVTIEGYFYTLSMAINGLFLPKISRYIADKKEENILSLMIKVGRYQGIVLGLVFVAFVCIGKDFMLSWMGPDYQKSYYFTMILLFPTLISATQQIAKTTVIAKKLIKYQAICMSVTGVLGLALSYVLSLKFGAFGVCIGTAVTSLANITYMNVAVYKKKAGINVFEFYKSCYFKLIPCYVVTIFLGLLVTRCIPFSGWFGVIVKGTTVTIIFAIVMLLFYVNNEEKDFVLKKLKIRK